MADSWRDNRLDLQCIYVVCGMCMNEHITFGMTRRNLIKLIAATFGCALGTSGNTLSAPDRRLVDKIGSMPRLYCVAYITPDAPGQRDQEAMVAKYPLAIVPQDDGRAFIRWRDRVKSINPDIVLLSYQMVIEETTVPGPGHRSLQKIHDSWCVYPGGYIPTVGSSHKQRRLFDPRKQAWQDGFLEASIATLSSYPYDGLFLDQCGIFVKASPIASIREEMREALQQTLIRLRQALPNILIVGNSRDSWIGLNGEMNESRLGEIQKELRLFSGHVQPRVELVMSYLNSEADTETVRRQMASAHSFDAFFAATVNTQHVLWFDAFDEVMSRR